MARGKVVICAGTYHTAVNPPMPLDGDFLREGVYLAHEHPPTKGRVHSIQVESIAVRPWLPGPVDWSGYVRTGSGYRQLVGSLQTAAGGGLVSGDGYYGATWAQTPLTPLFARAAEDQGGRNIKVDSIDWTRIVEASRASSPSSVAEIRRLEMDASRYDSLIVVPKSAIAALLQRKQPGSTETDAR